MKDKMTVQEYRDMIAGGGKKKNNKFGAKKKSIDDLHFDSAGEAERYGELRMMYKAKLISDPILQFPFLLPGDIVYKCDFLYLDYERKVFVVEDFKGHLTEGYKLKKKLMLDTYGIEIYETHAASKAASRR